MGTGSLVDRKKKMELTLHERKHVGEAKQVGNQQNQEDNQDGPTTTPTAPCPAGNCSS
jgi:hypothetical protein